MARGYYPVQGIIISGANIISGTLAGSSLKTSTITNSKLKFFYTNISTGKGSKTFAHGLASAPKIVVAYSVKNVTKVAFAFTFGATNVIINNPSLTTTVIIFAM